MNSTKNKDKIVRFMLPHLIIILFFILVTAILTYPQIRCMKQCVYSTGDQLYYAWMLDRNVDSLLHKPLSEFFNATIFYPYKNTLAFGDHLIGETMLAFPILVVYDNPVFAQNALILFSFIATAYGMYLLMMRYTADRTASIIAACIFTFSNIRFNQYDHLNLISTQWFPFIFLFLHRWLEDRKKSDLIALGFLYLIASLFTFYYFVFASFSIVMYIIGFQVFFREKALKTIRSFIPLFTTLFVVNIVISPLLIPYFQFAKDFPAVQRTIYDNVQYSATPLSFLYAAKTTVVASITGTDKLSESESGLFFGYAPLIMGALAFAWRRRVHNKIRPVILFSSALFLTYVILSFGPFPKIGVNNSSSMPLPYFVLYYLFPPFKLMRVPARFSILADIFLSILAGIGFGLIFARIGQKLSTRMVRVKKIGVIVGFISLIVMESWSVPLDLVYVELKQDFPPVYHWLAAQPSEKTILELPIPRVRDGQLFKMVKTRHAFLTNLTQSQFDTIEAYRDYFSILHKKRMVNGYNAFFPPLYNEVVAGVESFPTVEAIKKIRDTNIDFLIVHTKQFSQEWRDKKMIDMLNNPSLKLIQQFGEDYVYKVE